jgi:predicted lysophospholipase L1 biosynthesis ABC-type transport system permease subunit
MLGMKNSQNSQIFPLLRDASRIVGIAIIMFKALHERKRTICRMLKAIAGLRRRWCSSLLSLESSFIAIVGIVLGIVTGISRYKYQEILRFSLMKAWKLYIPCNQLAAMTLIILFCFTCVYDYSQLFGLKNRTC